MFDQHLKYGVDERGPYAEAGNNVSQLIDYLKVDLASKLDPNEGKEEVLPEQPQAMGPLPGANTAPRSVPFNIPDVLPGRSTGYSRALQELLGKFGKQYV